MRRRRSILSVPGSEARFHEKAARIPADEVMFDLEDSVVPAAKARAREMIVAALHGFGYQGKVRAVRINACDTAWCHEDVLHLVTEAGPSIDTLVVPKVDDASQVRFVDLLLSQVEARQGLARRIGLELQIESARALEAVSEIAAASGRTEALVFGPGDFAASLGVPTLDIGALAEGDPGFWRPFLVRILVAARAHGLQAVDGPYSRLRDLDGLRRLAAAAAGLGYDGKWALHPAQVDVINEAFSPAPAQLERAREILARYKESSDKAQAGAVRLGDDMIDEASRKLAQRLVERAAD